MLVILYLYFYICKQPPVPRRSRGERTSNIFHLKRNSNGPSSGSGSGGDLGLRVVGGKRMPGSNQLVAYITDVVEGGAAQKAGKSTNSLNRRITITKGIW